MFDPNSRYYLLRQRILQEPDGRSIPYVSRRFIPPAEDLPLLIEVLVAQSDRLDLIAARTLGDPEQYWRICDANGAMNPVELIDPPARRLRVPVPYPQEMAISMPLAEQTHSGAANALPPGGGGQTPSGL